MDFDELMTYIEEILAHLFTGDDIVDAFNMIDADDNGEVTDYRLNPLYRSEGFILVAS